MLNVSVGKYYVLMVCLVAAQSVSAVGDPLVNAFKKGLADAGCGSYREAAKLLASADLSIRGRGMQCYGALKRLDDGDCGSFKTAAELLVSGDDAVQDRGRACLMRLDTAGVPSTSTLSRN